MLHFINNTLSDDNDFLVKGSLPLHFTTNQPLLLLFLPHLIEKVVHVVNKMLKREISKAQKMLYAAQRWKLFDYFRKIINFFPSALLPPPPSHDSRH